VQIQRNIHLRIRLQLGPDSSPYVFCGYLREVKNCNDKFQNTWIVVAFLQLWKIVIVWNQITLPKSHCCFKWLFSTATIHSSFFHSHNSIKHTDNYQMLTFWEKCSLFLLRQPWDRKTTR
jgi:hypothetical protein